MHYLHRALESLLLEARQQFPAVLITGPRQAGKSTLLQKTLPEYTYVTLDDPFTRVLANKDPELFFSTYPEPLIIDEIQYAPDLFSYLKQRIDRERHLTGRFILTGSQTFALMRGVSESLAGRIAVLQLYPLSWREIPQPKEDLDCFRQLIQGFYPQFFATPQINRELWYASYMTTYLERDLRNIKAIADLGRFQNFLSLLAARAGQLVNMADLGRECGVTQPTVKDWLTILEASYIIFLLRPYHTNRSKRVVKTPKLFFVDTGLLCYLLGIDRPERLLRSAEGGHLFENMVIAEAVKQVSHKAVKTDLFFYRSANGVEVDLIIKQQGECSAYKIKCAKSLAREMAKPLMQFAVEHKVKKATVLSLQEKSLPLSREVSAEHWSSLQI